MSPVSLGHVVLAMDYLLMSILSMMALCCTVAVLDSSCDRTACQEYSQAPVRTPCQDSYVDREGHTVTMVTCHQEGVQMV